MHPMRQQCAMIDLQKLNIFNDPESFYASNTIKLKIFLTVVFGLWICARGLLHLSALSLISFARARDIASLA